MSNFLIGSAQNQHGVLIHDAVKVGSLAEAVESRFSSVVF